MKKLRIGVIGAGYLGTYHIQKYSRMDDVDLVGVVDIDRSRAEDAALKAKTIAYQDYKNLFGKVSVDAAAMFCSEAIFLGWQFAALHMGIKVLNHLLEMDKSPVPAEMPKVLAGIYEEPIKII